MRVGPENGKSKISRFGRFVFKEKLVKFNFRSVSDDFDRFNIEVTRKA
jgi:hypothetical protein